MGHKRIKGGAEKTREIKKIKTTLYMVGESLTTYSIALKNLSNICVLYNIGYYIIEGWSKKFSWAEKICQSVPGVVLQLVILSFLIIVKVPTIIYCKPNLAIIIVRIIVKA